LASDDDFTGEAFFDQCLDGSARRAVVAGEDGIDVLPSFGDGGVGDLLGVLGLPVLGPVFEDDLDFACVDERLEDVILALLEELGVVVRFRAVDADEAHLATGGDFVGKELGLEFADLDVVKGDVEVRLGIGVEAVVGQDGDALCMGHLDGAGHGGTVVRDDDEGIDPGGDEAFHIAELAGVVAIRRAHLHLRAECLGLGDEEITIRDPALLFQCVHAQADDGFAGAFGRSRGAAFASG
jgi:hypothetical protein